MKCKISVIMPIYNTPEKYLRECLESLLAQEMNLFELICVNDCSSESYVNDLLHEYLKKGFHSIRIIDLKEKSGAAIARNVGLKNAIGEYVIFLDSDDYYYPDFLGKLYTNAIETKADVCFCGYNVCDSELVKVLNAYVPNANKCNKEKEDFLLSFPWSPWTKMIRCEFLLREGISFQSLSSCNDVYFSVMTLLCANKISVLEKKLVDHRTGYLGQISSNRDPLNAWKAFLRLKKDIGGKKNYIPLFDKMLDGMLIVSCISEIKRSKDERKCKELYDTVRDFFVSRNCCFSTDRLNCLLEYLIDNNYESRWHDHNVFLKLKLENNSSYILESIKGKKILLWGLGERGDAFLEWAREHCITIDYLYDKDFLKTKKYRDNYHVVDENDINNIGNCIIIASNYSVQKYIDVNFENSKVICLEEWCSY